MKKIEEFIKINIKNNNNSEFILEIIKTKDNTIYRLLEEISNNPKLSQEEKNGYYYKIMDYVSEINENLKKKINNIYMDGAKEATRLILSNLKDFKQLKEDEDIEEYLNNVIKTSKYKQNL